MMRIFRWVLLTADVILLLLMVVGVAVGVARGTFATAPLVAVMAIIVVFLANIIFIAITWRYQRKGVGGIMSVFD